MQLAYLSGNGDSATFSLLGQSYSVKDGQFLVVEIPDGTSIDGSVPAGDVGHDTFDNNEICLCTRQYNGAQFYLFRLDQAN